MTEIVCARCKYFRAFRWIGDYGASDPEECRAPKNLEEVRTSNYCYGKSRYFKAIEKPEVMNENNSCFWFKRSFWRWIR